MDGPSRVCVLWRCQKIEATEKKWWVLRPFDQFPTTAGYPGYNVRDCPFGRVPRSVRSPTVKKGRHRRFEEARKLKQAGPSASDLGLNGGSKSESDPDDEYAAIAEKYGVTFDDDPDDDLDEADGSED